MAERQRKLVAALWMVGTLLSLSVMAVSGRELSVEMGTFQILFYRGLVSLAVISILLTRYGWGQIKTQRMGLQAIRHLTHFAGQFAWFFAIALIPLADVFAIEFTMPLWAALLAPIFLKERLTRERLMAVLMGFIGMVIILRPGAEVIHPGALVMTVGAFFFALAGIATKELTKTETPLCILFYMVVMQLPLSFVPTLFNWQVPSQAALPWLLLVGTAALAAHFCFAKALQNADALVVVPMDFLRLPLIAVVGFLLYNEALDLYVLTGALVMCMGNLISLRSHR